MQKQSFAANTNVGRLGIAMLIIGSMALTSCQDDVLPHPKAPSKTYAGDDDTPPGPLEAKPPIGGHGGGNGGGG